MPQVVNGLILGCPGVAGSPPISVLYDAVDPANSVDPNVGACQTGSLLMNYQRRRSGSKRARTRGRKSVFRNC